jgi:hypothetical protein
VSGHANAETLAAFREGLLSRRKAARVSAHLAACSRCAGLDAQLTEVSALLTRSTAPPMPDALTARIEAAIAAEAAARAATAADGTAAAAAARTGGSPGDGAARPSRPPGGPGRARLALRVAAVAAAVVVVAGGGYGVARLLSGNPESSSGASLAPAPAFGTGGKAAHISSGGLRAPGNHAAASAMAPSSSVVSSGTNYQPDRLNTQVSAVLTQHVKNAAEGTGPVPSPGNVRASTRQPACIAQVTGGARPLLIDHARYQGRPATVIVIPAGPGRLQALVVAGGCTATKSHVLATATLPAPG